MSHVCYTCEWFVFNVHPVSLLADSGAELGETESAMCISENKGFLKGLQESCDNHASWDKNTFLELWQVVDFSETRLFSLQSLKTNVYLTVDNLLFFCLKTA